MHGMRTVTVVCFVVLSGAVAWAGRYEDLTRRQQPPPHMKVVAATFFGGPSAEGFNGAVAMPDGTILAFGDACGPEFPAVPLPEVLGEGRHTGTDPLETDDSGRKGLKEYTRDTAGFMVLFAPDVKSVRRVIRFNWGVATLRAVAAHTNGTSVVIAGFCDKGRLSKFAGPTAKTFKTDVKTGGGSGIVGGRSGVRAAPAPTYLMQLDLNSAGRCVAEWCWVFEGYSTAIEAIWRDSSGHWNFALDGWVRVSADGTGLTRVSDRGNLGGQSGIRGFDPTDSGFFYGGDRNLNTGQEPWRQPFLYKFDSAGRRLWKLWEWPAANLRDGQGTDDGLVSDSSVRVVAVAPGGDLLVAGWSDGGNSVFTRQPYDVEKAVVTNQPPFSVRGMKGPGSISYILRLDPRTFEQRMWTYWMTYIPFTFADEALRGAPNSATIDGMVVLPGGRVALTGTAATGLIATPNTFHKYLGPDKYTGRYAAVLSEDFTRLQFSSYLPGYLNSHIAATPNGLVISGTSRRDDGHANNPNAPVHPPAGANGAIPPSQRVSTPPPVFDAVQPAFAGGEFDGHIILLGNPVP